MMRVIRLTSFAVALGWTAFCLAADPQLSLYTAGTFGTTNQTSASITPGTSSYDLDLVLNTGGNPTDGLELYFTTNATNLNYGSPSSLTMLNSPFLEGEVIASPSGTIDNTSNTTPETTNVTIIAHLGTPYSAFNSPIVRYHFDPSELAEGVYTLTAQGEYMTNGGTEFTTFQTPGSFTFTVVPEPATVGLLALAGLAMLRRRM